MAKYPRTYHLPWSPGGTNDDKRMKTTEHLLNRHLVITEKMDGGNVCLTKDSVFARSHSSEPTEFWFDWLKAKHRSELRWSIPGSLDVFCEYLYAVHTIEYDLLPSYLMVIGVRENNLWFNWDDVKEVANSLRLPTVPVLFENSVFNTEEQLRTTTNFCAGYESFHGPQREGLVVRVANSFKEEDFSTHVGKWVRKDHVAGEHWTKGEIKKQKLIVL